MHTTVGSPRLPDERMLELIADAESLASAIVKGEGDAPVLQASLLDERAWSVTNERRKWNDSFQVRSSLADLSGQGLCLNGDGRMQRSLLFDLASRLSEAPDAHELRHLVVNVNAWGYGTSGYAEHRTRVVVNNQGDMDGTSHAFATSARSALNMLRGQVALADLDPAVAAYHFLNNRSGGHVLNWGPAFFTKFLYFADLRNQRGGPGGALILDAIMAGHVRRLVPALGRSGRVRVFGKNAWTTPQYAFYLALIRHIAEAVAVERRAGVAIRADGVEAILFRPDPTGRR
jgi:hypothetical protein